MRERDGDTDETVRARLRGVWPGAGLPPEPPPEPDGRPLAAAPTGRPLAAAPTGRPPAADRSVIAAFSPHRRGVRALAAVAAVVVLVAGFLAWRAAPRPEPVAPASAAVVEPGPSIAASTDTILVSVTGRVRHPGLVRLPAGARVADAIAAAGGALPGTDLSFVNLARRVADGELLVIGVTPPPGVGGDGTGAGGDPGAGGDTSGKVNLNTATESELDGLPGIGPALAQRIIDYRTAHHGFRSIDELRQVSGIGDAKYAEIKDHVTV